MPFYSSTVGQSVVLAQEPFGDLGQADYIVPPGHSILYDPSSARALVEVLSASNTSDGVPYLAVRASSLRPDWTRPEGLGCSDAACGVPLISTTVAISVSGGGGAFSSPVTSENSAVFNVTNDSGDTVILTASTCGSSMLTESAAYATFPVADAITYTPLIRRHALAFGRAIYYAGKATLSCTRTKNN